MNWFTSKKHHQELADIEQQSFRDRLAEKLKDYETRRKPNDTATFHVGYLRPADPFDELHGDGIDADPRWLPNSSPYIVEETAITDLSETDLRAIGELRTRYEHHLHKRKLLDDPSAQELDRILQGDEE